MTLLTYKVGSLILIKNKDSIMNKLLTTLAAGLVATLSLTSANAVEFKGGVTMQSAAYYANVQEQLKDSGRVTNDEALAAFSYGSVFGEVKFEEAYGISFGLEYTPESIEIEKAIRYIQTSTGGAVAGQDTLNGEQHVAAAVEDMMTIYMGVPVMETGLTVKVGYMQASLKTKEVLATGSTYGDVDLEGMTASVYYDGDLGANVFYRIEGGINTFDDIKVTGSEIGSAGYNKITAELGGVVGKASLGVKF